MRIRPMNDRVFVKRVEKEQQTAGGIIIPDIAKEKPQEGEVVAVGPGKLDEHGKRIVLDVAETVCRINYLKAYSAFHGATSYRQPH